MSAIKRQIAKQAAEGLKGNPAAEKKDLSSVVFDPEGDAILLGVAATLVIVITLATVTAACYLAGGFG